MAAFCAGCHAPTPGTMMGFLDTVSDKAQALQLDFGTHKAVVTFDSDTVLKNVDSVADLDKYKRKGFLVTFEDRDGRKHATSIVRFDIAKTIAEDEKLSKDAFKAALDDPSVTVLDVRPTPMYQAAHVPGAVSMPAPAVADYPKHLPEDRSAPVVLYGPGGCLGPTTSLRVKQLGYSDVKIYPLGFADWTETEPSVTEPRWLRRAIDEDLGVIVIDVRGAEAVAAGHIRGAVNIPLAQLPASRQRFPSAATAPIVVYGEGSDSAARQLVDWGYRAVRVVPIAYLEWAQAGNPVATGPASGDIVYQPKPKPGTITLDEFVQLAKQPQEDVILVDLRNPIEVEEPTIDHVVNIPFDMLPGRMGALTSGPTPVFFCPTGARAEMAHNLVNEAGGKSRFLASGAVVGHDGGLRSTRPWWAP
ncbi:MAG: rhodanese-like domain-containing protein [Thiohalocapsa sp.]|jgi:rhodanese-related sulfurtransferase